MPVLFLSAPAAELTERSRLLQLFTEQSQTELRCSAEWRESKQGLRRQAQRINKMHTVEALTKNRL